MLTPKPYMGICVARIVGLKLAPTLLGYHLHVSAQLGSLQLMGLPIRADFKN